MSNRVGEPQEFGAVHAVRSERPFRRPGGPEFRYALEGLSGVVGQSLDERADGSRSHYDGTRGRRRQAPRTLIAGGCMRDA